MMIDGKTTLHGIMGNPVSHSLSPAMHNAAFRHLGLNSVYLPFPVADVGPAIKGLAAIGVRGVSVTIPHKEAVIPFLDEIDPVAERIGAVNTLDFQDGRVRGSNSDWLGANRALAEKMELAGSHVLLLGAGGSARALGFGLQEAGAQVSIASRTREKGEALARSLACPWHDLAEIAGLTADAVVNATSVGMGEMAHLSLVPAEAVKNFPLVMDIVYAPLETRLLKEAKAAGCEVIDGLAMLLYQGAAQFELWTGQKAPVTVMAAALRSGLGL
ncbi:MAG: shikimate dehydrogenase [Thermodesulfobacteriota bacterium]